MNFHIITAFPGVFDGFLNESILKRAKEKEVVNYSVHDLRDFTTDKHRTVDDYPYGGGPGMILKPEPIFRCVEYILSEFPINKPRIILTSATGVPFNQSMANEMATGVEDAVIIICGHYKGVDDRVRQYLATEEICTGPFVLTGGELPALLIVDSVVRLLPEVLGDFESAAGDSFQNEVYDSSYFTRPREFRNMIVPDVLFSGHHEKIAEWRQKIADNITKKRK